MSVVRKLNKLPLTLGNIPGKTLNRFTSFRTKSAAPRENFFLKRINCDARESNPGRFLCMVGTCSSTELLLLAPGKAFLLELLSS